MPHSQAEIPQSCASEAGRGLSQSWAHQANLWPSVHNRAHGGVLGASWLSEFRLAARLF